MSAISSSATFTTHAFPTFVIGIAGGSGSGKSTVTREVLASVGAGNVAVLMQDDYYLEQSHLSFEDRCKTNYDHPDGSASPSRTA